MALTLQSAVRSHVGLVRRENEDRALASPRLVAVADGVGGSTAGEVASEAVIGTLAHFESCHLEGPLPPALDDAVRRGNERIAFIASRRPSMRGMSTTLTAVALGGGYAVANIGDSRTYLLSEGELRRLTRDDSLVQALVDAGALDEHRARHHPQRSVVLEALDGAPDRRPALATHPARAGDRLLLCSDGLSDLVDDDTLRSALGVDPRERSAELLVELALAAGGRDNVTVVVADVVAAEHPALVW